MDVEATAITKLKHLITTDKDIPIWAYQEAMIGLLVATFKGNNEELAPLFHYMAFMYDEMITENMIPLVTH